MGDVLSYVEYRPERLMEQFRALAEDAVKAKRITPVLNAQKSSPPTKTACAATRDAEQT